MKQKGFAPILILLGIVLAVVIAGGAYYLGKSSIKQEQTSQPQQTISPTTQPSPTPTPSKITGNSENEILYCQTDSDCACGTREGQCAVGNKKYIETKYQCPDFCSGFAGNLTLKCISNKCTQTSRN